MLSNNIRRCSGNSEMSSDLIHRSTPSSKSSPLLPTSTGQSNKKFVSTLSLSSILLAMIVVLLPTQILAFDCGQYNTHMGATFDLRELERNGDQPVYTVEDGDLPCTTHVVEKNYTYIFNICGVVASGVPEVCSTLSGLGTAGAIQIDKRATIDPTDDWCYIVGAYSDKTSEMRLLDEEDPTKGLKLTYYGDYCNTPRVQRQFNIELSCDDRLNPVPLHALEYSHCVYTVQIPSVYGCPLECPVAQRKLCGGNGHCAYDRDKGAARCFCDRGWFGTDCSSSSDAASASSSYSPVLLGLIITLFIIIGVLVGAVVLMVRQVSAYRDDLANYQVLKSGDETDSAHGGTRSAIV